MSGGRFQFGERGAEITSRIGVRAGVARADADARKRAGVRERSERGAVTEMGVPSAEQ